MEQKYWQRFLDLVDFAITQTRALTAEFPPTGKWILGEIPRRII